MASQFFVYGTLKQGHRNESVWPCQPLSVQIAWTRGELFGGPHYPAMKMGDDRVLGELWSFGDAASPSVVSALDVLEGTHGNGPGDLYHRFQLEAFQVDGESLGEAFVYHLVRDPLENGFKRIQPNENGFAVWPESVA